ncbi:serine-rich adhesin for platelets-like [Schistocerca cancellata]|uniref:serine-rich adhesin for platelets-like n=1 Tax=Schistocerca cancellata TaxID=274614 RepID=UPI002117D763|nr:serine-rich adhesin for platelets-like [Schistocerca cancellata]
MRQLLRLLAVLCLAYGVFAAKKSTAERAPAASGGKRVVCYYTNWSVYRPGTAKFTPQNINPYLCTHLIYAFGGLSRENGLRPFDKYQDIEQGGYAKFTGLKTYNKDLKTMLAIGGWNEGSTRFSPLVADAERRKEFVKNVLRFLRQNHFDGLDLDWEYPAFRDGGKSRDRDNYALLVKELREEFDRESDKTGRPRLLLTMAVPAGIEYIDKGFDVASMNKHLDFMNILSYDYHSAFEPAVNHHSPLYSMEEDDEYNFDAQLTIDHTVNHYMKSGADRNKLVLGIPTYGRSYTLFNPLATELGSPADGPGEQGDSTREKGYLAYYEICENLQSDDWKVVQPNPSAMGPYAYKGNQWVSYDDMDIIKKKAQYVNDNGLGGIMFWAIDNDDFRGKCHGRPYPLIEAGKEAMLKGVKRSNNEIETTPVQNNRQSSRKRNRNRSKGNARGRTRTTASTSTVATTTTTTTTTTATPLITPSYTTPEPPTTPDPGSDFKCKDEGFFPHPRDCKKYFWCLDSGPSNLGIVAHQFTCPSGLFFNKAADSCDYARNVVCNKKSKSQGGSSSTLPPIKAATSSTTRFSTSPSTKLTTKLTTTTTTEAPPVLDDDDDDDEEELEEDDEYRDYDSDSEEDPQALKELINLIKKLGGVEQLEKQLNLQNSDQSGERKGAVTAPAVSRTLYNRIVSYNTARSLGSGGLTTPAGTTTPRYTTSFQNRPERPQNAGLEKIQEIQTLRREKPTYVTIRRERPSTREPLLEESVEDDDKKILSSSEEDDGLEEDEEYIDEDETPEVKSDVKVPFKEYITIQRSRPVTAPTDDTEQSGYQQPSSGVQEYSSPQRTRLTTTPITESSSPRYVTISRVRSTTESNTINFEDGSNRDISSLLNSDDSTAAGRLEQIQSNIQTTTPFTPPSTASDELKVQNRQNYFQHSTKRANILTASSPAIFESAEQTTKFAEEDGNIPISSDNPVSAFSATISNTEESTTKSFRQFKVRPTVVTTTLVPDTSSETTTRTRIRPGSDRRRFRPKAETTTSSSESSTESTETVKGQQRRFQLKTEATTVSEATEKPRPRFRPKSETTTGAPATENRRRPQNISETGTEENSDTLRSSQSKTEISEEGVTERLRRFRPRTESSRETEVDEDVAQGSTTTEQLTSVPGGALKPKLSSSQATAATESLGLGITSANTAETSKKRENNNILQDDESLSSSSSSSSPSSLSTIKSTSPITADEESTERSAERELISTSHISTEKVMTIPGTKDPATDYSSRYRDFSTVPPTDLLSTLQYSTVDEKEPVLSTSQHLLQTGIAEVTSSQAFSTTETVSEYSRSTSDRGSDTEKTSVPASKSTADPITTPQRATGRRRGTPKVVRRRKFGSGGRNATTPSALENGTRPRKFNFPRRPVLFNSTADKDMDLLESMDHLARDKPGLDNLLLPTQVTVAQSRGLSKATENRKPPLILSGRTTLASLAAHRATLSLPTTPIQSSSVTTTLRTVNIQQQQYGAGSELPVTKATGQLDSVLGPRAIFPQESGIIHPEQDHSLLEGQITGESDEQGDYSSKELSSLSDLSAPTVSTVRVPTSKYSENSYAESPRVAAITETPSQLPQVLSTLSDDVTESGLLYRSQQFSEYPATSGGDKTKSSYFTTERPRTSILFRSRNRGGGKLPFRSQETANTEPARTTTLSPKRGSSVTASVSPSSKETQTRTRGKPFSKISRPKAQSAQRTSTHSIIDYEYYDDDESAILDVAPLSEKVKIHSDGYIECLDQGNFPHPFSCKKFISCAKMENGELLGWEYTCPRQLSFDPIGGICNWSAGLGCKE